MHPDLRGAPPQEGHPVNANVQPESTSPSRRALLVGALGGIGVWVASAIGRASPVRAEGQPILVGGEYTDATSVTSITNQTNSDTVLRGTGIGIGVEGISTGVIGAGTSPSIGVKGTATGSSGSALTAIGVQGTGDHIGVNGRAPIGVVGSGDDLGVLGSGSMNGVIGQSDSGTGVSGSSHFGRAVHGTTTRGWAGYFEGPVFGNRYVELSEIGVPAHPPANRARLFLRDSGSGKTQLCVRFATGSTKVLAQEA